MIEKILPNLYRIEVPLPQNPLKAVNSYVLRCQDKSLIIDTGMNREECLKALTSGLRELDVDLNKTDFFITHMHADHIGLVSSLVTDTTTIYFNQPDADFINSGGHWTEASDAARINGFPEDELQKALRNHPGRKYSSRGRLDFHILKEGDSISIGDYLFRCVETPGHTKGHMCLYEPSKKILLSGDHILGNITPNISAWADNENSLEEYLQSLDKVYNLEVELVLPGHRGIFKNFRERIQELKYHHQIRASEVISILRTGGKNAFQVASQMNWNMSYECWELFPISQKWFALGEVIAHLQYLERKGGILREIKGQKIVFSLK